MAWVLEFVGDVAWTRDVVELKNASFAEQDDNLDELVERYRPSRIAMDQTGMAEKPVEDAQRRYGTQRVGGVLMTPAVRLKLAGSLKRRVEDPAGKHSHYGAFVVRREPRCGRTAARVPAHRR